MNTPDTPKMTIPEIVAIINNRLVPIGFLVDGSLDDEEARADAKACFDDVVDLLQQIRVQAQKS